jgi:hypothetical protein
MVTPPVSTPASRRGSEAGQRIDAEGGRVSVAVVLGGVVDHGADPPDPATRGLELSEVGFARPGSAAWAGRGRRGEGWPCKNDCSLPDAQGDHAGGIAMTTVSAGALRREPPCAASARSAGELPRQTQTTPVTKPGGNQVAGVVPWSRYDGGRAITSYRTWQQRARHIAARVKAN